MPAYHVAGLPELVRKVAEVESKGETVTQVIEGSGGWVVITRLPGSPVERRGT